MIDVRGSVQVRDTIDHVQGFRAAGVYSGIKKNGKLDFSVIVSDLPCSAAGVFTTNRVKAAPVLVDIQRLQHNPERIRAVVTNSGCANACTGSQGIENAEAMAAYAAEKLGCLPDEVLVLSTGVIGVQLPMEKIRHGIDLIQPGDDWLAAAQAIMTTDTRPKLASIHVTKANGEGYQIAGMSKGSGMIAPNMATMLSTVVTDVTLSPQRAHQALLAATGVSYNCIVVDGDTSTNDTVFLLANGASGVTLETEEDVEQFQTALNAVCKKLAQDIVRDGEGVTKFITVMVDGAADDAAARQIANTVAISPLVKTAFYGNDANWGRLVMAAGRAGIEFDQEQLSLWIGVGEHLDEPLLLVQNGVPTDYSEQDATAIISHASVSVRINIGGGSGRATIWTCDLSHEYVSINADYRT